MNLLEIKDNFLTFAILKSEKYVRNSKNRRPTV